MHYNIILADPPWHFQNWSKRTSNRSAASKYQTMPTSRILSLDIARIAADDCVLFLWAVPPMLEDALAAIKAWGFTYKTIAFTYIKLNKDGSPKMGMGYWTRQNTELCLLGVRGHPKRANAGVHSVVLAPFKEHSAKPPEVRKRIVELCGDLPRIELFARASDDTFTDGWDRTGLEYDGIDIAKFLEQHH